MKKIFNQEKQFDTNLGEDFLDQDCVKIREIIDKIFNKSDFTADEMVKAMEHTRTCQSCGEYFLQAQNSQKE